LQHSDFFSPINLNSNALFKFKLIKCLFSNKNSNLENKVSKILVVNLRVLGDENERRIGKIPLENVLNLLEMILFITF
jgi:hypothetical protein